ncbi:hypothetical protein KJ765_03745 [Candidatus Micrarchaeota archaeon]|nr:hypothetical protein [Candidatus Micrarchaeota archaeon]
MPIQSSKGQIELWMLTKFGMIFFIIALSAIVFMFQVNAKRQICSDQTQVITSAIVGRIEQVLESPAEDEQRAFAFPLALELGRDDRTRYLVDITLFHDSGANYETVRGDGKLIVNASPVGERTCERGSSIPFQNYMIHFENNPHRLLDDISTPPVRTSLHLSPSDRDLNSRSKYLIIIKCANKYIPPGPAQERHLWIQDCANDNVNTCINLVTDNAINAIGICGFPTPIP